MKKGKNIHVNVELLQFYNLALQFLFHISLKPCNSPRREQVRVLSVAAYLSEAIKALWELPAIPHESISGGVKANVKLTDLL